MTSYETAIRDFLVTTFLPDMQPNQIERDLDLLESGVVDSLGLLTLISWIEEHFEIDVGDEDLSPENFDSVAMITEYVEAHLSVKT